MCTFFVNAMVMASIAWWRWSLRLLQSSILVIFLPSLSSSTYVLPALRYLSKFISFMTSTNCHSSLKRLVTEPVVGTTSLTYPKRISRAAFDIYCELRRSLSMKPSGMSLSGIKRYLRFFSLNIPRFAKSSMRKRYCSYISGPYFSFT